MKNPRTRAAAPAEPTPIAEASAPAPTLTRAQQMRALSQRGKLYRLPGSGAVVRLRRPGLTGLIACGNVPNPIAASVLRFLADSPNPGSKPSPEELREQYEQNSESFVAIASLAFVEPKLILDREPDENADEIGPDDVSDLDYMWIVGTLVEGAASDLATFQVDD